VVNNLKWNKKGKIFVLNTHIYPCATAARGRKIALNRGRVQDCKIPTNTDVLRAEDGRCKMEGVFNIPTGNYEIDNVRLKIC
jgi:hypothetical protein